VNVVRLVVEHHQVRQPGQIVEHVAARISPVQHFQAVAGCLAGRNRQQRADDLFGR